MSKLKCLQMSVLIGKSRVNMFCYRSHRKGDGQLWGYPDTHPAGPFGGRGQAQSLEVGYSRPNAEGLTLALLSRVKKAGCG